MMNFVTILTTFVAAVIFASVASSTEAAIVIRTLNSSYAHVETSFSNVYFSNGAFDVYIKLPGGSAAPPFGSKLLRFAERVQVRYGSTCKLITTSYQFSSFSISYDNTSIPDVVQILMTTRYGFQNLCTLVSRFYFTEKSVLLNTSGKLVKLDPNDIKYSFELFGCNSLQAVLGSGQLDSAWIIDQVEVVGRAGGPAFEIYGIMSELSFPKFVPVVADFLNNVQPVSNDTLLPYWTSRCADTSLRSFPPRPAPVGFNFTDELAFTIPYIFSNFEYSMNLRFLKWSYSDSSVYVVPGLEFTLDRLLNTPIVGPDLRRFSFDVIVRPEFHNSSFYDPSFTFNLLFDPTAGQSPSTVAPLDASFVGSNQTVGIAVGVSVAVVAILALVAALVFIPSVRHKILPYSKNRIRTSTLEDKIELEGEDDDVKPQPAASSPQAPGSRGTWTSARASITADSL